MTDREFLIDVHDHLSRGMPQSATMLHLLRSLILSTPAQQKTVRVTEFNSLDALKRHLMETKA